MKLTHKFMPIKNLESTGFLGAGKTETDYVLGAVDLEAKGFKELQPDMDWMPYMQEVEYQNQQGDKLDCVTKSFANCNEVIWQRKYPGEKINFNDAFIAKMTGTDIKKGNTMYYVAEWVRTNGFLYQDEWKSDNTAYYEFYSIVPVELVNKAKTRLEIVKFQYFWIEPVSNENLMKAIKYSPLQIAVRTDWYKDANGLWHLRTMGDPGHCIELMKIIPDTLKRTADHYKGNEVRDLSWDFFIGYAMAFNITKITTMTNELLQIKDKPEIYALGADGKYYHIGNEKVFAKLFGSFDKVKVVDSLSDINIGSEDINLTVK